MTAIIKFNVLLNWFNEQSSTTLTWTDLDGPILYLYIHICSYWCLAVSLTLKAKALFSPMKCSLVKTRCSMLSMLIPGVEGFLWHLYCLSTHNNSSPFRREMNLMTMFYKTPSVYRLLFVHGERCLCRLLMLIGLGLGFF